MKLLHTVSFLILGVLGGCYADTVGYVTEPTGQVWIEGRYNWVGDAWVWAPGYYIAARPGYTYVQGSWERGPRGYLWREGRWSAGRPAVAYGGASGSAVYRAGLRRDGPLAKAPAGRPAPPAHGAKPAPKPKPVHDHAR